MLEEEGQVLGEIGEVTGRSSEAWSGSGLLEKGEEVLLKVSEWKWEMVAEGRLGNWGLSLRDAKMSTRITLPGHSLFWKRRRQRRKGMSCSWKKGEWKMALWNWIELWVPL